MKKQSRIRLYGARLNRFTYRFFIFIGLLALYSLVTGATTDPEGGRSVGIVVVVGLLIGIVFGWFSARDQRNLDRSQQLAAEVSLLYPDATPEERNHAYTLRRRREMRLEALLYLIFAVFSVIWFWGMYTFDALPISWAIGWIIIVPGLLLIASVLLIRSMIPVKKDEEMPDVSKKNLELAQSILKKKSVQPDHEGDIPVRKLTVEGKYWKADEYLRHERKDLRRSLLAANIAMIFFCVNPIILFMLGIIMVLAGGPGWFLLLSGVLALVSVGLWAYMTHMPGALETPPVLRKKLKQLKRCRALRDTILSYRMDNDAAEIVFAESGTARYPCDSRTYDKLFVVPRHEAIVVMDGDRIHSIALLPEEEEAAPAAALSKDDASIGTENDILLSDEALHRAVLREIECMKPSRRTELEAEIEDRMDRQDQILEKGLSNLTTLEQGELHKLFWADLHKSNVDIQLSATEDAVMKQLGVTRKDIMNMKKNPFTVSLGRKLLIAAVVVAIGAVGTAAVEKVTGAKLGFVYIIFSVISGSIALSCGEEVINIMRFRKLKKSYFDPQYRSKVLDAAVYKEIREQVKQRRGSQ